MQGLPDKKGTPIRYILRVAIITAIYFATAKYGLGFDAVSGFATLVWPPAGIALAAILIYDYRLWPAIAMGAFLVNWHTGAPISGALGIALGNTLEAICGAYLLRRVINFEKTFDNLRSALGFILLCAVGSTLIAATIGVISLWSVGSITMDALYTTWLAWWIGDMLGILIVTPFILTLSRIRSYKRYLSIARIAEALGLTFLVMASSWVIFFDLFGIGVENTALAYLIFFPLLILATVRFEGIGAALTTLLMSAISLWGTAAGMGPFIFGDLNHNLFFLQTFMASISITALVLSAALHERRTTIDALARQANNDKALLESIGEGVIATDVSGDIVLCNKAAETMLQITAEEAVGRRYDAILRLEDEHENLIQPLARPLERALLEGEVFLTAPGSSPYYYLRKNGTRFPIALTVSPIFMKRDIIGVVNVFRDITHEHEVDRAKSEFVTIASHQLRTPLSTLKWHSEALLSKEIGELNEAQEQYVRDMHHSNERMIELLNALLSLSQIEMGTYDIKTSPVDVAATADEILKELTAQLTDKRIHVKKHYDPHLPRVHTDRKFLRIIFQNLLSNSIKYSPLGTEVELKLSHGADQLTITVTDHGCGIPDKEKGRLFTKFFRASNARTLDTDGNGLGLYIVKSILGHIGGSISFVSHVGHGTTFTVNLLDRQMRDTL